MASPRFNVRQVLHIRVSYAAGESLTSLADAFNCNRRQIQDIVHGRTYKTAGGPLAIITRNCPHCMLPIQRMRKIVAGMQCIADGYGGDVTSFAQGLMRGDA